MTGKTVGHYRVEGKIGQGGMGVVYQAVDLRLGRKVALKFLPPQVLDENQRKRFLEEARTASLLQHPNICPIHDLGEVDGHLFFAMAFLEGQTLANRIGGFPMDIRKAVDIALQIAAGLSEAHSHGIVHRDIKCSNIVVTNHGHAYILDFGLALREGAERLTVAGNITGTPFYMSPEQAQGKSLDQRTDLWALGVVLFEMITGRVPFQRDTNWAAVHAIIHDPLPPVADLRPEVSQGLQDIIAKALQKEPADRWQSAAAMASALRRLDGSIPSMPSEMDTVVFAPEKTQVSQQEHHESKQTKDNNKPPQRGRLIAAAVLIATCATGGVLWQQGFLSSNKSGLPAEKHIAVLPFNVIGDDPGVRALADGLVETLTSKLSQLDEFQGKVLVIPASEIRSRKITSAEEARKIYGANLVVTGSAQVFATVVQFTVNLIDPEKMRQLSSKNFEFDAQNPGFLRDGAMDSLLSLLSMQLSREARRSVAEGETSNSVAYSEFLKGSGYLARYDVKGNIDLALESLQSAIKSDAGYANAYASLARAYIQKGRFSGEKYWGERAAEVGKKAVELGPNVASTHIALGEVYRLVGKENEAITELQRALQINPGNAEAYRNLASVLFNRGRFKEAEELYREAVKRRPSDWFAHLQLGIFLRATRQYEGAEAAYRDSLKLIPGNTIVLRNLAVLYRAQARYPEAREVLDRSLKVSLTASSLNTLGVVYYYEHRFQEASSNIEAAIDLDSSSCIFWGNLGMVSKWDPSRKDKAIPALRRAIELCGKQLQVTPKDYNIRINLAEYHARLGEGPQASVHLEAIPNDRRDSFIVNFALIYELLGKRKDAIAVLKNLSDSVAWNDVRNDPNLAQLWADPELQTIRSKAMK